MWRLAIRAMVADRGKLLTSLSGVAFAVILTNLQFGLLLGLLQKGSLLVDGGQADIWVGPRHTSNVDMGPLIPERWLYRIRKLDAVERADPYIVAGSRVTMPDGHSEVVLIVGCQPASMLGGPRTMVEGNAGALRDPDAILVDYHDAAKLGGVRVGDVRELNGHRARVVGLTTGNIGFTNNAYIFSTLDRVRARYGMAIPPGYCSYFLVKARPGTDVAGLCARIRAEVPEADVHDKAAYGRKCMLYWLTRTGIGISFGVATCLGLLVGLAVVAQTLYASVVERIKEYGTLKALGADDRYVARFLVAQSLGNAALGSAAGLASALVLAQVMSNPQAPVRLTWLSALASVGLITAVCLAAVWLPYLRVRRTDPASVLRS